MHLIDRYHTSSHFSCILFTARLTSLGTILCMSAADLERSTKLSLFDVSMLLKAVSYSLPSPPMRTALSLYNNTAQGQGSHRGQRLTLGCQILDSFLRGGILRQGITEVTGESSSGKTQICLQLCLAVQLPEERGGLGGGTQNSYVYNHIRYSFQLDLNLNLPRTYGYFYAQPDCPSLALMVQHRGVGARGEGGGRGGVL